MTAAVSLAAEVFRVRPANLANEQERNMILKDWKRCHRKTCFGGVLDTESYDKGMEWLIRSLLERCATVVACYDSDPDFIAGWAVTSLNAVHYCYVKHAFRRKGIAKMLLRSYLDQPTTFTHPISIGADWMCGRWEKIPREWVYNPFHSFRIAAYPKAKDA